MITILSVLELWYAEFTLLVQRKEEANKNYDEWSLNW